MADRSIDLHPLDISESALDVYTNTLLGYAHGYDLDISYNQARLCVMHLLYVVQVNQTINLTRITDIDEALVLHVLDSLLFCKMVDHSTESGTTILDMGTGAGFPGAPLSIVTDASVTLLDSVGKKVKAVDVILNRLGVNSYAVIHGRAEDYANQMTRRFDYVVARALASLPVLIEYAAPFLAMNGYLVLSKGNPASDELASGEAAAKLCGLTLIEQVELDLPNDLGHRLLLKYKKVTDPSVKLPRPAGTAKRNPLA